MPFTAYTTHHDYARHTLPGHPEHAGRIERIWRVLEGSGIFADLISVDPIPATVEQLARVHDQRYVAHVERAAQLADESAEKIVLLDPDTYVTPVSYEVAC